jgi:myo-inositol 2-dehydrogenase / D-chiro-inositol 1-dehydrogenase
MAAQSPLGIAVIGAGRIGQIHARNLAQHPEAKVVYVYDADFTRSNSLAASVGAASESLEAILASDHVQAVLVCSPTDTHVDIVSAAAQSGKAIFCEKPVDLDAHRVEACLSTVDASGVPLMVAFNRRFDPDILELKRRVSEGEIGDIELVTITSKDPAPPPIDYVKRAGGFFRDMLIHDFDMLRFLTGEEPAEVYAVGAALISPELGALAEIDTAAVTLRTLKGQVLTITSSRRSAYGYDQRIDIHGSKGQLALQNQLKHRVILGDGSGFHVAPAKHSFVERYADAYRLEMDAFVRTVKNGTPPSPNGWDGLKAQLLADAASESHKIGLPVRV